MSAATKTAPVAVRLTLAEIDRLDKLAKADDRNRSYVLQQAVRRFLKETA